jgi:hypothetical protein
MGEGLSRVLRAKIALKSFPLPPFRQGSYATREGGRGLGALPSSALPDYLFKSHKRSNVIRDR